MQFFPEGYLCNTPKNRQYFTSAMRLTEAAARGEILEAPVILCDNSHNLTVNLGCMRGIIPREEGALGIAEGKTRDIALISRVGKPVAFQVQSVNLGSDGRPYAILSRREAQRRCQNEYLSLLKPGQVIPARVTHLDHFGAFCDVGCGIAALLPIDSISVSRISHPSDRFRTGDDIRVVVKSRDVLGRITLSHKELLGTWEENAACFSLGETVSGIIRSVETYGVFVELTPNLAGLAEPHPGAKIGQNASVYIKNLLPDKMKVKLIIIDAFPGEPIHSPAEYFYTGNYLPRWRYSPESSDKLVETVFCDTVSQQA